MWIRNVSIVSLHEPSVVERQDVQIIGNRIAYIGQGLEPEGEVLDGSGCYLIPGMANLHAHTAMTLLRGVAEDVRVDKWFNEYIWVLERNLTPEHVSLGTLLGAAEMLLSGVTFVADMYFDMDQAAKAYIEAGMRADLSWSAFGAGPDWEERWERSLRFAQDYRGWDPRITVTLGPHSPYICPHQFLSLAARTAQDMGLKLHIHVSEEENQVSTSLAKHHMTPVQVLQETGVLRDRTLLAHAYYATDRDLELIRQTGSVVAHCPKTYMRFGLVNDLLPRALHSGIRIGLGTDGPASNSTMNLFEVARDAALLAKCATRDPEAAAIRQVLPLLSQAGELLGIERLGRIEEGALADLVLVDPRTPNMQPENNILANLLYSLGERNVRTVIVDGKVVVRDGELVSVDLNRLWREVTAAARTLQVPTEGPPRAMYRLEDA
jgi:5-methylthioadenosine/S-adenosylhomocysteine deaminase